MMSGPIGPSDGAGGITGPSNVDNSAEAGEVAELTGGRDVGELAATSAGRQVDGAAAVGAARDVEQLAAAIDAGSVSPSAALEQLIDGSISSDLSAAQRAELRELVIDLAASDPHLASLLARLG